jgi:penicillin-binding protein 2
VLKIREDRRALVRRIEAARIIVGMAFALLATAYWYVQIARGEHYYTLSENNRIRSVRTMAPRGYVLDRHGSILVDNQPGYTLYLYRREARNLEASIDFAAGVLKVPREQVRVRVQRGLHDPEFLPITVAENLGIEDVAAIEARAPEHPEFVITVAQRRLYTLGTAAAHALGYLSEASPEQIKGLENGYRLGDWMGQKGIEGSYEKLLAGVDGQRRVVVDSHGREITEEERVEARPGQNVFLTLDLGPPADRGRLLQGQGGLGRRDGSEDGGDPGPRLVAVLRSELVHAPRLHERVGGAARRSPHAAAEPRDPERLLARLGLQGLPRLRALAQGLVDPAQKVFCPGHATFYGRTFHCHIKSGHGWVNLRDAIKVSCDVYFYNLGRRLGIERIAEIARAFGFGAPTGIDLPFEKAGLVPSEEWARGQTARALVPERDDLRRDRAGAGPRHAAPGGPGACRGSSAGDACRRPTSFLPPRTRRRAPRCATAWRRARGCRWTPRGRGSCSRECGRSSTRAGGTAFVSRVPGLDMGGKTGTTQVVGREAVIRAGADRRTLADHAWFGGFATLDDPRLVVVVFVENGGHGGAAAAPLARQLFAKRFGKLLPPEPRKDVVAENGNRKSESETRLLSAAARFPIPDSRFPAQREQNR